MSEQEIDNVLAEAWTNTDAVEWRERRTIEDVWSYAFSNRVSAEKIK